MSAALYNAAFGIQAVIFPSLQFNLLGMPPPNYPFLWQCIGMIVGVYGIGYWIASADPMRHWPIILVGFLGKIFGPLGFAVTWLEGGIPGRFIYTIILNDLIWWIPFAMILWEAARYAPVSEAGADINAVVRSVLSDKGKTLSELSGGRGLLVVFLRHMGCTFCREALDDISKALPQIQAAGFGLALVHMSDPVSFADAALERGLQSAHAFSDPNREIYRAFELKRGGFLELFGPRVILRGIMAARHGLGRLDGDGFQMPGAFVLQDGKIVRAFRHKSVSDRPEYGNLCVLGRD